MCQKNVEQKEITLYGEIPEILRGSNDSQCKMALCHYSIFERKWQFCALGTIYHHYDERVWNILFGINQKKKSLKDQVLKNRQKLDAQFVMPVQILLV